MIFVFGLFIVEATKSAARSLNEPTSVKEMRRKAEHERTMRYIAEQEAKMERMRKENEQTIADFKADIKRLLRHLHLIK